VDAWSLSGLPPDTPQPGPIARAALAAHLAAKNLARAIEIVTDATTLGIFPDQWADLVTAASYALPSQYQSEAYNAQGLFDWEERVVREFFPTEGTVLVTSAGGGREVHALLQLGYRVVATECVGFLAALLARSIGRQGGRAIALHASPDSVPREHGPFDAVVVGWGAYTHIVGSERRISFLRKIREVSAPGAPILLSYWECRSPSRSTRLIAAAANALRRPLRRRLVEVGESTSTRGWSRTFQPDEVRAEAVEAGLVMVDEPGRGFAHMVLRRPMCDLRPALG